MILPRSTVTVRPQTLDQAYEQFVGNDPMKEADWDAYEDAVNKIITNTMPTQMGHSPDCIPGRYPMSLGEVRSVVIDDEPAAVCIYCNYRLA